MLSKSKNTRKRGNFSEIKFLRILSVYAIISKILFYCLTSVNLNQILII